MTDEELSDIHSILMSRRKINENGCWIYIGWKLNGYGNLKRNRKNWRVHRLAWWVYRGEDPGGFLVCHKCDDPACFNPDHLFLGTSQDNMDDMRRKGRARYKGRPSGIAILTREMQQEIYEKYRKQTGAKVTLKSLAKEYDVSTATIFRVIHEKIG